MKNKKSAILFLLAAFVMVVALACGDVTALSDYDYTTTITLDDGHNIDVANVESNEVVDIQEYIKTHLNTDLVQDTGIFEVSDILYVKHLIADENYFNDDVKTIDSLNDNHMDALLTMNDFGAVLYDLDEDSDYYVAYADTIHNDVNYYVADSAFAYTNLYGQVISDAIYDYDTGLAYIPKKYKAEDRNGLGYLNVQIELLQMTYGSNPTSTMNIEMDVKDMPGTYADSGVATVKGIAQDFGIKVALDDKAIANTYSENIRVYVNGIKINNWYYFDEQGIVVIKTTPNTVDTVKIEISKENADVYMAELAASSDFLNDPTSLSANTANMDIKTEAGTWHFDFDPEAGQTFTFRSTGAKNINATFVDVYSGDEWGQISRDADVYSNGNWDTLASRIVSGENIDLGNLTQNGTYIQHEIRFNSEFTQDGITIPGNMSFYLKCSHGSVAFDNMVRGDGWNTYWNSGAQKIQAISWTLFMRIFEVQEDYLIVGFCTNVLYNQNGVGICKIAYTSDGGGYINIHKSDSETGDNRNGDATRNGAVYGVYNEAGNEVARVTLDGNGNGRTSEKLKNGTYTVREISAPAGYNKSDASYSVTINRDNKEPTAYVSEDVIKGNIKVNKKLGATDYDPEINLEGARFKATLNSDTSKQYYSNYSGADGVCQINGLPYGTYTVEECDVPNSSYKANNFQVFVGENGRTYESTIVDSPKLMDISVQKEILVGDGEDTDAVVDGAIFTVYKDAAATQEYKDKIGNTVTIGGTDANGYAISQKMRTGTYYLKETTFPTGIDPDQVMPGENTTYRNKIYTASYDNAAQGGDPVNVHLTIKNEPTRSTIEVIKLLGETDYDPVINLAGAQFRATLKSNRSFYRDSNVTTDTGKCYIQELPYGTYEIEEIVVPPSAYKIPNFDVFVSEDGKVYSNTKTDESKTMQISVTKTITLWAGEATDAVVNGAVFTVYLDAQATQPYIDKVGNVVTIGPTDENGYAISRKMRTGTYYLKETTFPRGIDPDAVIAGENVTYRNKVYTATYDNATQGNDSVVVPLTITNEPKRNHIVIMKNVGETSNTSQQPLDGCEFTATLISSIGTDHEFSRKCTAETTRDTGYCIIEDLPYGEYVIEETKVSPISLKCDKFTLMVSEDKKVKTVPYEPKNGTFETEILNQNPQTRWLDLSGNLVDIPKVMVIKMHKVDYDRTNSDPKTYMQGDANLQGAIYQIYRYDPETDDYTEYVYDITVDHLDDGYWTATSDELAVGKYMVKEKIKYSETVDGVKYDYSYAEGYLSDPEIYYFDQNPAEQTERLTTHVLTSKEKVIRGALYLVKFDEDRSNQDPENDSDVSPAAGAVLKLTLDSNPDTYYTVKLDNNGYGEFIETNDATHTSTAVHDSKAAYYPYTIPYGKYTITEVKEADETEKTSFYVQPEPVEIETQVEKEYRIFGEEAVPTWVQVIKKDRTTNKVVPLSGATFKIWEIAEQRWVSMKVGVGNYVDEFQTNDEGYFYTPQKLNPGEYVIYEVKAPAGYYLDDDLRIPENPSDIGDKTKGGKYIKLDKVVTGLTLDAIYPGGVDIGELVLSTDIKNTPSYVNIKIIKTGEKLTGSKSETVSYETMANENVELEKTTPVYTANIGIEGVGYKIYANEDIYTPDGELRTTAGTLVDDVTTNSEGIAQSRLDLFPGQYKVVEYKVPAGYLLDPEPKYIKVENKDQYVASATGTLELSDVRQKLGYKFQKLFEQYKYSTGIESKHAVFGIYTKEPIANYQGDMVIDANTLVDMLIVDGDNYVETTTDLPEGKYYVKELYVSFPYALATNTVDFEVAYNGDGVTTKVMFEGENVINTVDTGYAKFIKLSKSNADEIIVNGSDVTADGLDRKARAILEMVKDMTREEIYAYFKEAGVIFVPGAKYEIWLDTQGTNKLKEVDIQTGDLKVAQFTTDNIGILELFELPKGAFYLKEVEAPKGYEIQNDVVPFTITASSPEATLYQAIYDDNSIYPFIHKTDIYTGKEVPNCLFEIRNSEDEVLLRSITGDDGVAWIPEDMFEEGETYYYVELEAPSVYEKDGKLYELNTEPHEFTAHFDEEGNWAVELTEVENLRPLTDVKFIKTDEEGNLVPNCKFELKSVEEGLYYETGVTDENGIYVFKNVPQGDYIYTELEAPEEYDLDTTPHEVYVTGDEMIIEFVNTGDIPVVAIAVVALVCVAGIAYVVVRKVKASKQA